MTNTHTNNLEIRKQEIVTSVNAETFFHPDCETFMLLQGCRAIHATSLNRILVRDAMSGDANATYIWVLKADVKESMSTREDIWTFEQVLAVSPPCSSEFSSSWLTRDDYMLLLIDPGSAKHFENTGYIYGTNYVMIRLDYDVQTDVLELKPRVFEMDSLTDEEKETFRRLMSVLTFKGEVTRRTRMFFDFLLKSPTTEQFKKFTPLLDPIEIKYLRELYLSVKWELASLGLRLVCLNEHMLSSEA